MSPVFRHGRLRLYLLRLLDEEPRHGYEVIRLLRDRFMGIYAPSPGTIYPRLARLEEEGLVTHDEENGRKVYRITEAGREELRKRSAELDELEAELSASVNDIVREVREDVRETVRTLREELTWAAREMRRGEQEQRDEGREQAKRARDTAREQARATREQARAAGGQAKQDARQAREQAREQARQAGEQARAAREDAMRHAQRIKEGAASLRDDALNRFRAIYEQASGERDPWAQGTREGVGTREGEPGPGDHAEPGSGHDSPGSGRPGSDRPGSGESPGGRDHDGGGAGGRGESSDRGRGEHDWGEWGSWLGWDWRRWGDWPGRKGWAGPRDMAAFRDLEHLARDFAADMRKVAWESESLGGDVVVTLRDILQETMERVKSEVFGHAGEPADTSGPERQQDAPSAEHASDAEADPESASGTDDGGN
ncbi:MAG: helix-turn-helix transcriptional regulator [Nocardiopsaceae bacterium]|nr:helix-turn-helix transcriptional regulator [Nocardiopsaceae bacterium]